jgi:hypothetical protein
MQLNFNHAECETLIKTLGPDSISAKANLKHATRNSETGNFQNWNQVCEISSEGSPPVLLPIDSPWLQLGKFHTKNSNFSGSGASFSCSAINPFNPNQVTPVQRHQTLKSLQIQGGKTSNQSPNTKLITKAFFADLLAQKQDSKRQNAVLAKLFGRSIMLSNLLGQPPKAHSKWSTKSIKNISNHTTDFHKLANEAIDKIHTFTTNLRYMAK